MPSLKLQSCGTIASIRIILEAGTKARVFLATLDLAQPDAEFLRGALIQAAREAEAVSRGSDEYGDRFTVDFEISRRDEVAPRLTSCFVL